MNKDTELRKLPAGYLSSVEETLETNEDWKKLMSHIPKNLENLVNEHYELKYNGEHIRLIENEANETKMKCAKVLFDEWGTSGRVRPTLKTLQTLLVKTEMFKAADSIAIMLNEPLPQRPSRGPGAPVDVNVTELLNDDCTTRQLITSSNNCNDTTKVVRNTSNSQHLPASGLGQQPSASDMIEFSKNVSDSQHLPPPDLGQQPAKDKSASDMIEFSKTTSHSQRLPPSDLEQQPKGMSDSDMIAFSKNKLGSQHLPGLTNASYSQFIPDFGVLNPQTIKTNTMPVAFTGDSETQFHSDTTQSSESQSKYFQPSFIFEQTDKDILEKTKLIQFAFNDLEAITNNFSDALGSGGFGDVFLGSHDVLGLLAVKKAHNHQSLDMVMSMFITEVNSLSLLHHENIVPIIGFSRDGPAPCIVCEYIDGGSLKQKIADKVLNESQRMNIMIGTAEGLKYLHNTVDPNKNPLHSDKKAYFIHGDVKSANIMLTKDCLPKLCDFGLAKQLEKTHISENLRGTKGYMAPESLSGTITQKSDVYGFGIVLLELLTGLQVIVRENNEQMHIKEYLEENSKDNDISTFLDKVVDRWINGQNIYDIAQRCLNMERDQRPSMDVICSDLHNI